VLACKMLYAGDPRGNGSNFNLFVGCEMSLINTSKRVFGMLGCWEKKVHDLRGLGAPLDLLKRATRAENCLRQLTEELLQFLPEFQGERASGISTVAPDLYVFAMENSIDGCFGDACFLDEELARLDSVPTHLARVTSELARLVRDHSDLCWELNDWCLGQLSPQRGRNIRAAQREAVAELQLLVSKPKGRGVPAEVLLRRIEGQTAAA
jgi:hypothetical protein